MQYITITEISLEEKFRGDGILIFEINHDFVSLKILLLYKRNDWCTRSFYELLSYLSIAHDIDFIMGDFNIKPNEDLKGVLTGYVQKVDKPTHLAGGIIDHVYVKESVFDNLNIYVDVVNVFFRDHELIRVSVCKKE